MKEKMRVKRVRKKDATETERGRERQREMQREAERGRERQRERKRACLTNYNNESFKT